MSSAKTESPCLRLFAAGVLLVLSFPVLAEAQRATGPVYESYLRAMDIVGRALEAHGGAEAVRTLRGIEYRYEGHTFDRDQGLHASSAYELTPPRRAVAVGVAVDFATGRRRSEFGIDAAGEGRLVTRTVQRGREILRYSPAAVGADRTFTRDSLASDGSASFPFQHQLMPVLVLRQAIVRSATLRHLGRRTQGGISEEIVSFNSAEGSVLAMGFDAKSGVLNTVETVNDVALFGDTEHVWRFGGYEKVAGVLMARTFQHRINGLIQEDMRLAQVSVNPEWTDTSFAPAADYTLRTVKASEPRVPSVADSGGGVYFIEGLGGYRSMVVATGEALVVVEAPQSVRVAEQAISLIERALPGKQITHLVLTHHHLDHVGGARAYVDRGVTIVVPDGMDDFLRRVLSGTRTLGTLGQAQRLNRTPIIESVSSKRRIGDLELVRVSTSHAASMLLVQIPKRRVVFQADLFQIDDGGAPRPSVTTVELVELLKKHAPDVETVASVHGRNATVAELRNAARAMEARR